MPQYFSETSISLLDRARSSDQQAWERLVKLYSPLVYAWCRSHGIQEADALNVGQEVFLSVAQKLNAFQRSNHRGSFRCWLYTITKHKIADYYRIRQTTPIGVGGETSDKNWENMAFNEAGGTDQSSLSVENEILYERALELLRTDFEEKTWQAFWRTSVDGIDVNEVADELQMTTNAIYLAKSHVKKRIREELQGLLCELEQPSEDIEGDGVTRLMVSTPKTTCTTAS